MDGRPPLALSPGAGAGAWHDGRMEHEHAAWAVIALVVRKGGGAVTPADMEAASDALTDQLEARGLQVSFTRALPVTQQELESRDLSDIMRRRAEDGERPL